MLFESVKGAFPAAEIGAKYMFWSQALNHSRTLPKIHEEVGKINPQISSKNYKRYAHIFQSTFL